MYSPLVSVIVPTFNASKYISSCIVSIINQTYTKIELCIIDDASTDNTIDIIHNLLFDVDIKYRIIVNEQNRGVSYSRNIGIKSCEGDYIAFVDADDMISSIMIEKLVTLAIQQNEDIIGCKSIYFSNQKDIDFDNREENSCLTESILSCNHVWGKLYRKEVVESTFFNEKVFYGEDILWFLYLSRERSNLKRIDSKLYAYRNNPESVTSNLWKTYENAIKVYEMTKEAFVELHKLDYSKLEYLSNVLRFCRKSKTSIYSYLYVADCKKNDFDMRPLKIPIRAILISKLALSEKIMNLIFRVIPFVDTYTFYKIVARIKNG